MGRTTKQDFKDVWKNLREEFFQIPTSRARLGSLETKVDGWRSKGNRETVTQPVTSLAKLITVEDAKDLSIGPMIRLAMARLLSGQDIAEFEKDIKRRLPKGQSVSKLKAALDLSGKRANMSNLLQKNGFSKAIVSFVNEVRHERNLTAINTELFWEKEFCEENAIQDFLDFIGHRDGGSAPFVLNTQFIDENSAERRKLVEETIQWVLRGDIPLDDMVRNVYANGLWRGLSAFGRRIDDEFRHQRHVRDNRECLYLPLGLHGRGGGGADPQNGENQKGKLGVDLLDALSILRHFYTDELVTIEARKPIGPDDDLLEIQDTIRKGMIKTPKVLILDGIHVPETTRLIDTLEEFISGDTILDFLSRALDSSLSNISSLDDLRRLSQNRVLILSNTALENEKDSHEKSRWALARRASGPKSVPLPQPDDKDAEIVIKGHAFTNEQQIIDFRATYGSVAKWSDLEYFALDALFSVVGKRADEPDIRQQKAKLSRQYEQELRRKLEQNLRDTLSENPRHQYKQIIAHVIAQIRATAPLKLWIFEVIALAPEGARTETIRRVLSEILSGKTHAAEELKADLDDYRMGLNSLETLERPTDEDVIRHAITATADLLSSILTQEAGDAIRGLDAAAFSLEMDDNLATWEYGQSAPLAVAFIMPELRTAAKTCLITGPDEGAFERYQILCRYLALDAMSQQAVALRHSGANDVQLLYPWRRQISAIAYGLQSIPIECNDQNEALISDAFNDAFAYLPSQYANSRYLWRWLYLFAYRRMIEQPPAYKLSRLHGLNEFKLAILRAFEKPWLLWPEEFANRIPEIACEDLETPENNLFLHEFKRKEAPGDPKAIDAKSAQKQAIMVHHFDTMFHAGLALSDTPTVTSALAHLKRLSTGTPEYEIYAINRVLEFNLLNQRPIEDALRIVAELVSQNNRNHDREDGDQPLKLVLGAAAQAKLMDEITLNAEAYLAEITNPASRSHKTPVDQYAFARSFIRTLDGHFASYFKTANGNYALSDFLFRLAERLAVEADTWDVDLISDFREAGLEEYCDVSDKISKITLCSATPYISERGGKSGQNSLAALASFCCSLALFDIAEEVRLGSFSLDPISSTYLTSGHAIRQLVRTSLKLHNLATSLRSPEAPKRTTRFMERARYGMSTLSRYLYTYPHERSAMLLLEASALRLTIRENNDKNVAGRGRGSDLLRRRSALELARSYLARAEPPLKNRGITTRWRLRLALERAKIHRQLGRITLQQARQEKADRCDEARFWFDLAKLDVDFMEEHVNRWHDLKLWKKIQSYQASRLRKAYRELDAFQ